jgi:hypothetical protein
MHPALVLFLLLAPLLLLNDRASADCEPATCGKLALRYPFWLGNVSQTSSPCGHPAFEVWCSDDRQSVASLRGSTILVHTINYTDKSFIASNTRVDDVCHTDSNLSITVTQISFKLSLRNRALYFLYNCNGTTPAIGSEYVNATSKCSAPIYAYLGGTYSWGKPPEITVDRCSYSYIPVMEREGATMTAANYSRLLKDGFVMEWEASGIGDCAACKASGGQCRYDNATAAFWCLCLGGRRTGSTCAGESHPSPTLLRIPVHVSARYSSQRVWTPAGDPAHAAFIFETLLVHCIASCCGSRRGEGAWRAAAAALAHWRRGSAAPRPWGWILVGPMEIFARSSRSLSVTLASFPRSTGRLARSS